MKNKAMDKDLVSQLMCKEITLNEMTISMDCGHLEVERWI
jgi:hypothetical protein